MQCQDPAWLDIDSPMLTEWMAYDRIYPFGQNTIEEQVAKLTALTFNINKSETTEPAEYEDYMRWRERPIQTIEDMRSVVGAAKAAAHGSSRKHRHGSDGEDREVR